MKRCDEFEVEIEMRLHGALDATAAAELDAHLGSCAPCRAFETLAQETEMQMITEAMTDAQKLNWDSLKQDLRGRFKETYKQLLKRSLGMLLLGLPVVSTLEHPERGFIEQGAHVVLVIGLLMAYAVFITRRREQQARKYEETRGDLLDFYRSQVEKSLKYASPHWMPAPRTPPLPGRRLNACSGPWEN